MTEPLELQRELFTKLVKSKALTPEEGQMEGEVETIKLTESQASIFLNGHLFGKFMLVLKSAMVTHEY